MAVAVQRAGKGGCIAPNIGGTFDLGHGLRDRLARFQHLLAGDGGAVAVDQIGDPEQQDGAVLARCPRPCADVKGGACSGNPGLGLNLATLGRNGNRHPMRRRKPHARRAIGAVHPCAADPVLQAHRRIGQSSVRGRDDGQILHVSASGECGFAFLDKGRHAFGLVGAGPDHAAAQGLDHGGAVFVHRRMDLVFRHLNRAR